MEEEQAEELIYLERRLKFLKESIINLKENLRLYKAILHGKTTEANKLIQLSKEVSNKFEMQ